jgi:hypothetical protein
VTGIFRRRRRPQVATDEASQVSDRADLEARQASANEAYRETSSARDRDQATANEAYRRASDERARLQAIANEASRVASDEQSRRQASENDARHRSQDG